MKPRAPNYAEPICFAVVTFPVTLDDEEQLRDKQWAELVKARAGERCEDCGATGVRLEAHHVNGHGLHWARRNGCKADNRLANGRCLCVSCHARGHVTPERLAWLAAANTGRVCTPETRAKIGASQNPSDRSAATKKLWESPEHRAKIGAASKRLWQDPEYRAKQSASRSAAAKRRMATPEGRAHQLATASAGGRAVQAKRAARAALEDAA